MPVDFGALPPWLNALLFAAAAAAVWFAGTRLAGYVDAIGDRTNLGKALMGLVVLAGATELPELVTTTSAVVAGNAPLAVNNMFGGIALQTAVLAIADATIARGALTWFAPRPVLLLEGNLLIVLLALTAAAALAGEVATVGHVGLWPLLLLACYVGALRVLHRTEGAGRWRPVDPPGEEAGAAAGPQHPDWSLRRLVVAFALASLAILVAGACLAWSADALAVQSGLGASFLGASLLAAATSLPELSTTIAAIRIGSYAMAVSNIFGSNMIMVALLLPADVVWTEGPILAAVDASAMFALAIGIAATALYVIGLVERRNRTFLRMGYDSVAVLVVYLAGLGGLYLLR